MSSGVGLTPVGCSTLFHERRKGKYADRNGNCCWSLCGCDSAAYDWPGEDVSQGCPEPSHHRLRLPEGACDHAGRGCDLPGGRNLPRTEPGTDELRCGSAAGS